MKPGYVTITLVTVSVLVLVLTLCGCRPGNPSGQTEAQSAGTEAAVTADLVKRNGADPVAVRVEVVKKQPIVDPIILPCSAEPFDAVKVSAEIAGRVVAVTHEEGEPIKAGEVLLRLDPGTMPAEADRAQASLTLAEATFSRIRNLFEAKQISETQMDQARADRDIAKANLEEIKIRLAKTVIQSPLAGDLERRYVDVGEYVVPGMPVAEIVQINKLKVYVQVPERDVIYVGPSCQVMLKFGQDGEASFPGVVRNVDRVADPVTRTFRTEIVVDNKDLRLRPGMIGKSMLLRGLPKEGIAVRPDVIIARKGRYYVVVEENGKAVERDVTPGILSGEAVEILSGLKEGDRLIVAGHRDVNEGEPVEVKSEWSDENQ